MAIINSINKEERINMVEYSFSRLCFKADIIEQLNDDDKYAVHTPYGVFQMSKAEFYETFPNSQSHPS